MKKTIAIVVSTFYTEFSGKMEKAAIDEASRKGLEVAKVVRVPGAFDSPLAIKKLLERGDVDGVAVLGAVIKGDTAHDQIVATNAARSITELSLQYEKPVTLGIIGHNATYDAVRERAEEYAIRAVDALWELLAEYERL